MLPGQFVHTDKENSLKLQAFDMRDIEDAAIVVLPSKLALVAWNNIHVVGLHAPLP